MSSDNDIRIARIPQIDPESLPSVVWTEVLDIRGAKIAAISFRVITTTMSEARWATEALHKVKSLLQHNKQYPKTYDDFLIISGRLE